MKINMYGKPCLFPKNVKAKRSLKFISYEKDTFTKRESSLKLKDSPITEKRYANQYEKT
jgi:hypothetical protein